MKILLIHNYYKFKGGEDSVVEAEKELLEKNGNDVYFLSAHNDSIKNVFKTREQFYIQLEKIISTHKIDIAHIHNVYQIIGNKIYDVLHSKKIPIIQTLHNFRFLCPAGLHLDNKNKICEKCSNGKFISCFKKKCYQNSYVKSFLMKEIVNVGRKKVLENVDIFIALNSFYKQKFINAGFPDSKIIVKPNFIDTKKMPKKSHESYALYIGRISIEKGLETLIESFKEIKYDLKIVGSGDSAYLLKLKSLCSSFSNIQFIGFASGLEKEILLKNASFLIIPSICYENFPITILEAYSYGKPVIATKNGGLIELVKHNQTGYLFESGDIQELINITKKIIKNELFLSLGLNAYDYYSNNFTEIINYPQLKNIYKKAIALN
jgi:glycosyltransferase involved in cell wall biosynthesis